MKISILTSKEIPWKLLLLADPSEEAVKKYIYDSDLYVAKADHEIIGVLVLKIDAKSSEIMNVAVSENHQGKGIGSQLIRHAIDESKKAGLSKITIGTADTSISQLALYQKLGFNIHQRVKDFFISNYSKPIFENGKQAKDMIKLAIDL